MAVVELGTKKDSLPTEVSKLPFSVFSYWDWSQKALCLNVELRFYFISNDIFYGKTICSVCPVKQECLIWALIYKEEGVWGGTTERERKQFPKSYVDALIFRAKDLHCYSPKPNGQVIAEVIQDMNFPKAG